MSEERPRVAGRAVTSTGRQSSATGRTEAGLAVTGGRHGALAVMALGVVLIGAAMVLAGAGSAVGQHGRR